MGDNSLHLLPYFHGLLPREDLIQLLKISGDFVIRSTEPRPGQQRQFVLSVMIDEKLGGDGIKHLIFSPGEPGTGKYLLGTMNDTAPKIVEYYLQTRIPITHLNEFPVVIKNPIGRQKWELLHDDIQVEQKLGAGAFGEVCMGKLKLAN
uniref:SH2 domain-containing protein n=1 Tax=Panagrolaimus sp. PS1159 TaxID=55785 RepID=A0AC35F9J4_9BILA